MNGNEQRPQDRSYTKKPKPPTRTIQITLDLQIIQGIELMASDSKRRFHNVIEAALCWAVWAHSHGRGPDDEMFEDGRGYSKWDEKFRERCELERLYKLGGEK
jgi:hypothetical protein